MEATELEHQNHYFMKYTYWAVGTLWVPLSWRLNNEHVHCAGADMGFHCLSFLIIDHHGLWLSWLSWSLKIILTYSDQWPPWRAMIILIKWQEALHWTLFVQTDVGSWPAQLFKIDSTSRFFIVCFFNSLLFAAVLLTEDTNCSIVGNWFLSSNFDWKLFLSGKS